MLPLPIWRFDFLLIGRHETMAGYNVVRDFRIVDLERQALFSSSSISLFGYSVSRSTNVHEFLHVDAGFRGSGLRRIVAGLTSKILLVFLSLCVSQI